MATPLSAGDRNRFSSWKTGIALVSALLICGPPMVKAQENHSTFGARISFLEKTTEELPPPLPPEKTQPAGDKNQVIVPIVDREEVTPRATEGVVPATAREGQPEDEDLSILQMKCSTCGPQSMVFPTYPGNIVDPPPVAPHPHSEKLRDQLFWGCLNCGVGNCVPGRNPCYPCCHSETAVGRFFCNLYHCICCPDPCYEGKWMPIADSAFFVEAARPVSHTKLRWDAGVNMILPDRSEFFWARADGMGKGPRADAPALVVPRLRYHELNLYTEIATGPLGVIVEMPYRSVDPDFAPHAAGFADMSIATKTLLFDCELLQVAMQMKTTLPTGASFKGLGVGHVSLEPSLIFGIKLHQDAYLQGQIAEWIPLGGDQAYAGAILHYHFSANQVLWRLLPDVPLIGTLEFSGFSFQDGAFTDPVLGPWQQSSDSSYFYLGAGLRMFVCDRIDFGFGVNLALTDQHFSDQLFRSEFRFRY